MAVSLADGDAGLGSRGISISPGGGNYICTYCTALEPPRCHLQLVVCDVSSGEGLTC